MSVWPCTCACPPPHMTCMYPPPHIASAVVTNVYASSY
jgi:hypothetical protein